MTYVLTVPTLLGELAVKASLLLPLILVALPVWAADPPPPPVSAPNKFLFGNTAPTLPAPIATSGQMPLSPSAPLPITWEVWSFQWDGSRWVKQPTHCLKTADLKQAVDYVREVMSFAGWNITSNIPSLILPVFHVDDPFTPSGDGAGPTDAPPDPIYTIWVFKLVEGKWQKDETYCRATDNRLAGLDYAQKINAIHGWCAVTNCPENTLIAGQNHVYLGAARGTSYRYNYYNGQGYQNGYSRGGYPVYSEHGGRTIYRPHMTIRLGADADWHYRHTPHPDPIDQ